MKLVQFLSEQSQRARDRPGEIANRDLETFLEAASGWLQDMDGYFANQGQPVPEAPTWSLVAMIVAAAQVYE